MAHYSEMDFLFSSKDNQKSVTQQINNTSTNNSRSIFNPGKIVIYKSSKSPSTESIKNYIKDNVYKNDNTESNPYVNLINDFKNTALEIKASDLAYLKDLGVYPINRLAILRRFREGGYVSEDITEMKEKPISTIIGWIKPDQNFGQIGFNENWSKVNQRFDQVLMEVIQRATGGIIDISRIIPIPDFAQGMLFEFYKGIGLGTNSQQSVNEDYEFYNSALNTNDQSNIWGLNNIPVGNPNLLQEGPFRDPVGQNIQSTFSFELETTYEQKLIGDVDPGSAMLDILDNMYAMGTSNMAFYWGSNSPRVQEFYNALKDNANNLYSWWNVVDGLTKSFWGLLKKLLNFIGQEIKKEVQEIITPKKAEEALDFNKLAENMVNLISNNKLIQSILTSTVAIHRFKLRGSIELMVGGKVGTTPWYLTLGNPYSPWLATNHIIVRSASVETSPEMGFNDQPQWLKVKFTCEFSRALGKQELMRMFNNSYRRTYSSLDWMQVNGVSGAATEKDPRRTDNVNVTAKRNYEQYIPNAYVNTNINKTGLINTTSNKINPNLGGQPNTISGEIPPSEYF